MSGRGKGAKKNVKSVSRSSRAGLQFPVARIHRFLKKGTCISWMSLNFILDLSPIIECVLVNGDLQTNKK